MSTNEISPRRFPRSPVVTPPRWRKPEDVMRKHKVKMKQNALLARMNTMTSPKEQKTSPFKRKNPFSNRSSDAITQIKKKTKSESTVGEDSLLEILGFNLPTEIPGVLNGTFPSPKKIMEAEEMEETDDGDEGLSELPVDWSLRSKMRFVSAKPFPFSLTLKTCEEASGITGFVRCLSEEGRVDTSLNAEFHSSCLVWLQPHLPWIEVFPRHSLRRTAKLPPVLLCPQVREALHRDFANSFRSLFQLVRARHCPYFYLVANSFTCLFRAAGINASMETTASIAPTTKGFRKLLSDDGIEYSEPLRPIGKRRSSGADGLKGEEEETEELADGDEMMDETDEGAWLSSLGIPQGDTDITICDPSESLSVKKDGTAENGLDESLVLIKGSEVLALLNFLINCKSVVSSSGPLAGLPPTLISPVAFPGGTLTPLKTSESTVKRDGERFHTLEVRGPILPSTVLGLTSILQDHLDSYSVTFLSVDQTKPFNYNPSVEPKEVNSSTAFNQGALTDSGLDSKLLSAFCSSDIKTYDSLKHTSGKYYLL